MHVCNDGIRESQKPEVNVRASGLREDWIQVFSVQLLFLDFFSSVDSRFEDVLISLSIACRAIEVGMTMSEGGI